MKKHNRFNGVPEDEVLKKKLPDILRTDLDIVIVGINPGLISAYKGHHYAGPSNHFWKCLNCSGLFPKSVTPDDDSKLVEYGIGFTNVVERTTKSSSGLTKMEISEGCKVLLEKLRAFRPKIAVFNGKLIYEVFCGRKIHNFGLQAEFIKGTSTHVWVMPSSSARCAHFPKPSDKLPFYLGLRRFLDSLKQKVILIDHSEFIFPLKPNRMVHASLKGNEVVKSEYFNLADDTNQKTIETSSTYLTKGKKLFDSEMKEMERNLEVLQSVCNR